VNLLSFNFLRNYLTPQELKMICAVALLLLVGWGVKSCILKPTEPPPAKAEN
jgi:hypothetical protein|tara:strand:+ start:1218 stop:1373 length:156 start_codon:yes stop_codon:yes gene_type:complete